MITPGRSRRSRPRKPPAIKVISLLWPDGYVAPREPPPGVWEGDLGLGDLVQTMSRDRRYLPFIRQTLVTLSGDPIVIAWRQAVFGDFQRNAALAERLEAILPRLSELRQGHALLGRQRRSLLLETADRLSELDLYLTVVQDLYSAVQDTDLQSAALLEAMSGDHATH